MKFIIPELIWELRQEISGLRRSILIPSHGARISSVVVRAPASRTAVTMPMYVRFGLFNNSINGSCNGNGIFVAVGRSGKIAYSTGN